VEEKPCRWLCWHFHSDRAYPCRIRQVQDAGESVLWRRCDENRLQVQNSAAYSGPRYRSSVDCILKTIKFDGPQGLFRGLTGTLVREMPGNVAWFGVYEWVSSLFKNEDRHLPDIGTITAGAAAGVAYWTIPYPADTVKTRIQISTQQGYNANTSFLRVQTRHSVHSYPLSPLCRF